MSHLEDNEGFDNLLPPDPYASIPDEMKQESRWLVYRMEPRPDGRKNKIPYDPKTGRKANNPELGVTYQEALSAVKDYSGLGFYVEPPYLCVDLDGCIDPKTGDVSEEASQIVRDLNTFAEVSPSFTGIHVWGKGTKPGTACRRDRMELYTEKRFITISGIQVPGTPKEIRNVDIAPLYNQMVGEKPPVVEALAPPIKAPAAEVHQGGNVVTSKLVLLQTGNIQSTKPFIIADDYGNSLFYPSQSEADGALAMLLARKHDGDAAKMDADFRVSSLYRPKWDRADYRDATLKSAIAFHLKSKAIETPPNTPQPATVKENDEDEIIDESNQLPIFPDFTGTLADLADAMSPDIPRAFKFISAVTHMGLIGVGLDTLHAEPHLQPRFYTALIAQPGRGKTAAINEVTKIFRSLSSKYQTFSSIDSGPALVDAFNDQVRAGVIKADATENLQDAMTAKILLSPDELKGIFEKAKITAGSRNSMLDELLKLYEGNTTGNRVRGMKIKIHIENAHLGLLGGATESGYGSMWTGTGGAADGLQSRIVPIGIEDRKMPPMQDPADGPRLTQAIEELRLQVNAPAAHFDFDKDAKKFYEDWWNAKDQTRPSEIRIDGIVKRLMIVLARTNNVLSIDKDIAEQATEFGDFVIACREKYNPLDASTWSQMFENLIIAMYQKHGDLTPIQCRRMVHPERRPGGVGPYMQAYKNLTSAGVLREVSKTQRSVVYRLVL